jgi:hypothetical protein
LPVNATQARIASAADEPLDAFHLLAVVRPIPPHRPEWCEPARSCGRTERELAAKSRGTMHRGQMTRPTATGLHEG